MYSITLGNGRVLENVSIEGITCFTREQITPEVFDYGLHELRITKTSNDDSDVDVELAEGVHKGMKIITCCPCRYKPGYMMFQFAHMNERDIRDQMIDARLDYFDMMLENN